ARLRRVVPLIKDSVLADQEQGAHRDLQSCQRLRIAISIHASHSNGYDSVSSVSSVVKDFPFPDDRRLRTGACCTIPRMPRKPKPPEDRLTEVARTVGSTLGTAKVRAEQVVEGIKAAAKAGADAYTGSAREPSTGKRKSARRP